MGSVKRKRREIVKKNQENKLVKKSEIKTKEKTKGKSEVTAQKAVRMGMRLKGRQGAQGMFVKGLRSEFVTRGTLNEVNEARKKEDINRIVDIGRIFLQKKKKKKGKVASRISRMEEIEDRKAVRRQGIEEESTDSGNSEFECSLSPISLPSIRSKGDPPKEQDKTSKLRRKKLDLERELRSFSLKYEETVGALVLHKLSPEGGVLENAREALTKLRQYNFLESSSNAFVAFEKRNETFFEKREEEKEGLIREVFYGDRFRSLFDRNPSPESFQENSSENVFTMKIREEEIFEKDHSSSFIFDNEDEDKSRSHIQLYARNFEKSDKELSIATPPIQFYRRNMF